MVRQLQLWRDQTQLEDRHYPTDWLGRAGASLSHRTDLAPLALCWNVADLVRQDPAEIARQIQSFHADRLMAFLRVPVTAYRLSSSVTECLLRSFRFDASRPHWLTHVILRQLLVDEAPERQGRCCTHRACSHLGALDRSSYVPFAPIRSRWVGSRVCRIMLTRGCDTGCAVARPTYT